MANNKQQQQPQTSSHSATQPHKYSTLQPSIHHYTQPVTVQPSPQQSQHQQQQQQTKSNKKQRKLTKSPQVSCDISFFSSSPTNSSGISPVGGSGSGAGSGGFNAIGVGMSPMPSYISHKYIAYPSSLPNHYNDDESLMKNFEYIRTDLASPIHSISPPLPSSSSSSVPAGTSNKHSTTFTTIPSPIASYGMTTSSIIPSAAAATAATAAAAAAVCPPTSLYDCTIISPHKMSASSSKKCFTVGGIGGGDDDGDDDEGNIAAAAAATAYLQQNYKILDVYKAELNIPIQPPPPQPPPSSSSLSSAASGASSSSTPTQPPLSKSLSVQSATLHHHPHQQPPTVTMTTIDSRYQSLHQSDANELNIDLSSTEKTNFIVPYPVTIPTCCLKSNQLKQQQIQQQKLKVTRSTPTQPQPQQQQQQHPPPRIQSPPSDTNTTKKITPPTQINILNDQLRHIKQIFQGNSSSSSLSSGKGNSNSLVQNNNTVTGSGTSTTKDHLPNETINHNPFTFSNIFKSSSSSSSSSSAAAAVVAPVPPSDKTKDSTNRIITTPTKTTTVITPTTLSKSPSMQRTHPPLCATSSTTTTSPQKSTPPPTSPTPQNQQYHNDPRSHHHQHHHHLPLVNTLSSPLVIQHTSPSSSSSTSSSATALPSALTNATNSLGGGGGGGGGAGNGISSSGSCVSGIGNNASGNGTLTENNKRDEFLKATMKICLVVSPPSNKLLQLKSKSLTHLDTIESNIGTQTESLTPKPAPPVCDYLEVEQNNTGNTICCLSSSPPSHSSSSSSIKKKSPSLKSYKKPILTRSAVSSSEYFCVCYDLENSREKEEEFIPAVKGTTLADALYSALNRRNLSFSQITITDNNSLCSVDLGSPPYSSGINQNTDVGNLAGKYLIVTEKEKPKKSGHALQKAASFGARQRPAKLFQSASTEETTELGDANKIFASSAQLLIKYPTKQRWSGIFGIKNPHQNQLCDLLNHYAKYGVPQSNVIYTFEHENLTEALDYLINSHSSWTEFVNHPDMTDSEIKIQSAIWELVTTEIDYIHALLTVKDLFLACLEAVQTEHILTDIDQNKLFSNIRDICEANISFWTTYLFPMVKHSIVTGHQMCIDYFQSGFVTFASTFSPYKKYCAEQSTCQFYCRELHRNNGLFQAYLAWCESQKMCKRLRLADILVRPMQRLTKYSLLLSAIRKHIVDENDAEIMDAMVHSVENFVCGVNSHLTARQENERLKGIMARIESYDVVDSNNEHLDKFAKQYSSMFDLCGPMRGCASFQGRHLFMEGDLKFKDSTNKFDVHCFLLTDMLLVCKAMAKKGLGSLKVIRQPFITDRLVVKVKDNTVYSVYLNDFNVAVTAFTLQCAEAKSWHDAIVKAKHIYTRLKQGSSWDGYNIKYGTNEMLVVRKSPLNSSIGSRVSSLNNSHSGSVELTESKTVSIDYEKTNSLSSDEGVSSLHGGGAAGGGVGGAGVGGPPGIGGGNILVGTGGNTKKISPNIPNKLKVSQIGGGGCGIGGVGGIGVSGCNIIGSNTLIVQPLMNLGQSLPNLNVHSPHSSNNTLLVPGTAAAAVAAASHSSGHSNLLSPSHRGISYPPPSPTRATLRRGFAFSSSIKNPPLIKSRNITSQNSFNLASFSMNSSAAAASTGSPQPQLSTSVSSLPSQLSGGSTSSSSGPAGSGSGGGGVGSSGTSGTSQLISPASSLSSPPIVAGPSIEQQQQQQQQQQSFPSPPIDIGQQLRNSNESDV